MLTRPEILKTFGELGIEPGCHLLIHSSLHRVGPIDGGADGLIDALIERVGPDGTVAAPTSSAMPGPDGWFDPRETPSGSGIFTEILRRRPGAVRSLHPTHSVAVIGLRARELTDGHLEVEAVGIGSPFDRIARAGGYVVLLGVTHTASTTIHVGEAYAGMAKDGRRDLLTFRVRLPDGRLVEKQQDNSNSCSSGFNVLELPLRLKGQIRGFRLGRAPCLIMKGQDLIDRTVDLIRRYPDITRCMQTGCIHCRRWGERTGGDFKGGRFG